MFHRHFTNSTMRVTIRVRFSPTFNSRHFNRFLQGIRSSTHFNRFQRSNSNRRKPIIFNSRRTIQVIKARIERRLRYQTRFVNTTRRPISTCPIHHHKVIKAFTTRGMRTITSISSVKSTLIQYSTRTQHNTLVRMKHLRHRNKITFSGIGTRQLTSFINRISTT